MDRARSAARRLEEGAQLRRSGWVWLAAAASVLVGSLLVVAAAAEDVIRRNGMERHDGARLHWFVAERSGSTVAIARAVTQLGSPVVLVAVAAVAGLWLWRRGSHLVVAAGPAVALVVAGAAATLAKAAIGRPRPPVALHLVTETEPSFPSGHATDSTALYISLALVVAITVLRSPRSRAAVVGVALALAGSIGLSRLLLGVHWPSDVIAGWALGLAVAVVVATSAALIARTTPPPAAEAPGRSLRPLARAHRLAVAERGRRLTFTT